MFSGGKIVDPVASFLRAIEDYRPGSSLKPIIDSAAAGKPNDPDFRQASLVLNGLTGKKGVMGSKLFASSAKEAMSADRAAVLGTFLSELSGKNLDSAVEVAVRWFEGLDIPIEGKYV